MHFAEYVTRGVGKLIGFFWGLPRLTSVLVAILEEVQELEDVFRDIEELRTIDNADATRLTVIGKLVGQGSLGLSTEGHRALIRGRIRTNNSTGITDDFKDVAALLGIQPIVAVVDHTPPHVVVQPNATITAEQATSLHFLVPDIRRAGVGATTRTVSDNFDHPTPTWSGGLAFASSVDPVTTPGYTFASGSRS